MTNLSDIQLMSPRAYFSMECGKNMAVVMGTKELVLKGGSTLLILYDVVTNITLLAGYHNGHVTKIVGGIYKCVTNPLKTQSLSLRESDHEVDL